MELAYTAHIHTQRTKNSIIMFDLCYAARALPVCPASTVRLLHTVFVLPIKKRKHIPLELISHSSYQNSSS